MIATNTLSTKHLVYSGLAICLILMLFAGTAFAQVMTPDGIVVYPDGPMKTIAQDKPKPIIDERWGDVFKLDWIKQDPTYHYKENHFPAFIRAEKDGGQAVYYWPEKQVDFDLDAFDEDVDKTLKEGREKFRQKEGYIYIPVDELWNAEITIFKTATATVKEGPIEGRDCEKECTFDGKLNYNCFLACWECDLNSKSMEASRKPKPKCHWEIKRIWTYEDSNVTPWGRPPMQSGDECYVANNAWKWSNWFKDHLGWIDDDIGSVQTKSGEWFYLKAKRRVCR